MILKKLSELDEIKTNIKQYLPYQTDNLGKLIRSTFGILIIKYYNLDVKSYINLLCATELIHNASLLHDDVIDNETTRRGVDNIKTLNGNRTAILYGDIILSNAITILSSYNSLKIINIFNKCLKNMCEGELAQNNQLYKISTIEEYLDKTRLKTASLFSAMIEGIQLISDNIVTSEFLCFAKNFGIAFQIQNDLDNILGSKSDSKNGIYTAPIIYSNNIEYTELGIEKTIGLIDNYKEKCLNFINKLDDNIYRENLIGVVKCLRT